MTNTFMESGTDNPEEIVASIKKGIYAVNFGGGQVDITSGKFVFSASEAYLVENGKIGAPVKGATLIGNGPDAMSKISMIGSDMALDDGVGTCGKAGQSVPVGVGQPTVKMGGVTVGGTEALASGWTPEIWHQTDQQQRHDGTKAKWKLRPAKIIKRSSNAQPDDLSKRTEALNRTERSSPHGLTRNLADGSSDCWCRQSKAETDGRCPQQSLHKG